MRMLALVLHCAVLSERIHSPDGCAGRALLMPRMSLAGSRPMGSSMRFTAKNMEFPACTTINTHHLPISRPWQADPEIGIQHHVQPKCVEECCG